MRRRMEEHSMDGVFVLLLFGTYAALIVIVLLLGANNYKNLVERDNDSYNKRIGISYIAAKVRHGDTAGGIMVGGFAENLEEISTLHLFQELEEETYETRIYFYDGYIREILTLPGLEVAPEDGNIIMKASALEFAWENNLLFIKCKDESGTESALRLCLRSEGEMLP